MSNPKPYQRQQHACPNCNDIGAVLILRNGTEYGFQCPCAKGHENYNGLPMLPQIETISDGKLAASGEIQEDIDW
jgi:hypothetical protein